MTFWKTIGTNIDLMSTPILALCIIMMILTMIGLIGTQLQLMNLYKQVAFSLAMTGMNWGAWKASWLSIFCLPLWACKPDRRISGQRVEERGHAGKDECVHADRIAISVAIVLLSAIGILPTIGRWSRIDINEFMRLSE